MHPLIIIGAILTGALLWLLCSFLYKPIGGFFYKLWHRATDFDEESDSGRIKVIEIQEDDKKSSTKK